MPFTLVKTEKGITITPEIPADKLPIEIGQARIERVDGHYRLAGVLCLTLDILIKKIEASLYWNLDTDRLEITLPKQALTSVMPRFSRSR